MNVLPKISVIIPFYNAEMYIEDALKSVFQQTLAPFEIFLIDDGSSDGSATIISKYCKGNVIYIYQENKGPASARNVGIKAATGDFIAFLDADDLWLVNTLQLQFSYFSTSTIEIIRGSSKPFMLPANDLQEKKENVAFIPSLCTALFKADVFDKYGYLDERLYYGEDVDWFLRASQCKAVIETHNQVVHLCRMHPNKITNNTNTKINLNILFKIVKNSMERQREGYQHKCNLLF